MRASDTRVTSVIMLPQQQAFLKGTKNPGTKAYDTQVTSVASLPQNHVILNYTKSQRESGTQGASVTKARDLKEHSKHFGV